RGFLADVLTVHHGHMPEIEITGPDTASGIWSMVDIVQLGAGFKGYGHYHDEYRKQEGGWRIARMRLTRLLIEPGNDATPLPIIADDDDPS
ncbi:MAG: nuclear transport factor 2 family protein, partial [Proteobacteria bacterium]|nr:nuclear transport factor 2 family protein [Pseudomonadota bacterium]